MGRDVDVDVDLGVDLGVPSSIKSSTDDDMVLVVEGWGGVGFLHYMYLCSRIEDPCDGILGLVGRWTLDL